LLFDRSRDNWYVTVGAALLHDPRLAALPTAVLFLSLAIPSALFSPLGEELFFRGLFHESIAARAGQGAASFANGVAFGLMHLVHHGITAGPFGLEVRPF